MPVERGGEAIRIRMLEWVEGTAGGNPMFEVSMKLLRSAVRNVVDGTVCYPGESEGGIGLMTPEPYSLPTLPEMSKQGASYQSREWNIPVDGFTLPRWQPAPLLNTLWKQFLLCNAGESQQIINLSQYSPSARKRKCRLHSCKGIPFLNLKDCQLLHHYIWYQFSLWAVSWAKAYLQRSRKGWREVLLSPTATCLSVQIARQVSEGDPTVFWALLVLSQLPRVAHNNKFMCVCLIQNICTELHLSCCWQ